MNCKNKLFMTKKKAFTLIELLIVIAIIGILFVVLVSKVDFATDKAKASGVQTDFRSFQVAFEQVAKENAGFNTLGWDTGDTNGDRVRNSYDVGDTNKDGVQDSGETWTGRKSYTETWTGVYTLVKPGTDVYDPEVIATLESAINKNLDLKLHITISTDGIITMANGAQDPWNKEYHGRYLSNAGADKLDRGVIIMYSDGANGVNGSADGIAGGLVNITTPGSNKDGKDDYAIATVYTYANGYGEVKSITYGFSNNQSFGDANTVPVTPVGQAPSIVVPTPGDGTGSLPTPDLSDAVIGDISPITYEWSALKALAQANLSADELRDTYGIEVGDYKEVNGVKYILVDLGTDNDGDGIQEAGEDYDGFVFMYSTGQRMTINNAYTNQGGYASSNIVQDFESLYNNLSDAELKDNIKQVTVVCNNGFANQELLNEISAHIFLPSSKEVNMPLSGYRYEDEGEQFDYMLGMSQRLQIAPEFNNWNGWWVRTAVSSSGNLFYHHQSSGVNFANANEEHGVVACFVIG